MFRNECLFDSYGPTAGASHADGMPVVVDLHIAGRQHAHPRFGRTRLSIDGYANNQPVRVVDATGKTPTPVRETVTTVNRYHVGNLAYFCDRLQATEDADGNLLDHVLIYKSSNMGNSHRHAHEKVPTVLVGGIDGRFEGNRHLVFPDNTERCANLLLSILHLFDIEQNSIGESTHPIEIV